MAGLLTAAAWLAGLLAPLQSIFVFAKVSPIHPGLPGGSLAIVTVGLTVAICVARFGARRTFLVLACVFVCLGVASAISSWLFSVDILFAPLALSASLAALGSQVLRLRQENEELTSKLIASSSRLEAFKGDDASHSLLSGLQLLDTVLSPSEAIVFRQNADGHLVSSARLRLKGASSEPSRNSVWRDGVSLCERAIDESQIVVEQTQADGSLTNVALPLKHEDRTVGALLIRAAQQFDEDDRALLTAVGGQMARNLQREEAHQVGAERKAFAFFSAKASNERLQSLYALNGALLEQRVGVNALTEIADGVALAYLDGRIAFANNALLTTAGLIDTRNLSFFQLLDRFKTEVFDEPVIAVRRVLQTGVAYERELSISDKNETHLLRIALVSDGGEGSSADDAPQPLCLALVVRDLTRIKEYDQLKSDMISLMSHELRTPLTSINGFAELLTTDDTLPEQAKEFVTIIANESQRLSRMINTFLAVTKLQRKDRQEVLKIPLRLDEVVKETIANLQPVARKRRIRLIEQPSQKLPPVAADKSMITQAVKNLVSNAIRYSPERTTVTVSTALEAEAVRLCVEDRGYGIPAEAKDRVWEKFYRVVREGEDKDEESTGLGLSFVREVVEQHGGCVELESEVGRGSKFSFTLPRL